MKDTEQILTAHKIDNPTDAALVRLAGSATAQPREDVNTLLKRVNFAHPNDATLARAIVETIHANTPPPAPSKYSLVATALCAACAVGFGVWSFALNRDLASERVQRQQQADQFSRQVAELQAATSKTAADLTIALKSSDTMTRANTQQLAATLAEYLQRVTTLTTENETLRREVTRLQALAEKPAK